MKELTNNEVMEEDTVEERSVEDHIEEIVIQVLGCDDLGMSKDWDAVLYLHLRFYLGCIHSPKLTIMTSGVLCLFNNHIQLLSSLHHS
jgi:hypothetical protein